MTCFGLYGATGSSDFGDWAMMVINARRLLESTPDSSLIIYTPNRCATSRYLQENLDDRALLARISVEDEPRLVRNGIVLILDRVARRLTGSVMPVAKWRFERLVCGDLSVLSKGIVSSLMKLDSLIFNGGGYLQSSWGYHNLDFAAAWWAAGGILGIPVWFLGCSIGPMGPYDCYIRRTIHVVNGIMVRDASAGTAALLEDYGYHRYIQGPDDLLFECVRYSGCAPMPKPYVAIEVMTWASRHPEGVDAVASSLIGFARWLIGSEGMGIVLVCLDPGDVTCVGIISRILEDLGHGSPVTALPVRPSMREVFATYANCEFSLSFKYHPMVMALGCGKPCLGVICDKDGYYEAKMRGACENVGFDADLGTMHLAELTCGTLMDRYRDIRSSWRGVDERRMTYLRDTQNRFLIQATGGAP